MTSVCPHTSLSGNATVRKLGYLKSRFLDPYSGTNHKMTGYNNMSGAKLTIVKEGCY